MPRIYIVIGVHSRGQYDTRVFLQDCVASVARHTSDFNFIFVDDYSDEAGRQQVNQIADMYPSSYVIRTNKQRWFTRSFNLGLRLVRSPWCIMMNSDCVVDAGWLEELEAVREEVTSQGHKVGLVGSLQSGEEPRRYSVTQEPGYVTGHCWLVSMQALYEISCFRDMPGWYLDERALGTAHICSDNEACYTMNKLGWTTVLSYKSAVGHHGGKSWGHQLGSLPSRLEDIND